MEQVAPPEDFVNQLIHKEVVSIAPPPGVSREHCVDAQVCLTSDWAEDGMGFGFVMFFEPTPEEIEHFTNGGLIKLTIRGNGLVPHSVGLW